MIEMTKEGSLLTEIKKKFPEDEWVILSCLNMISGRKYGGHGEQNQVSFLIIFKNDEPQIFMHKAHPDILRKIIMAINNVEYQIEKEKRDKKRDETV